MFRLGLYLIVAITMFSSVCRAFSTPAVARGMNRMAKPSFIARSMSTTGEAETSIVDVCKGKISKALETDDVTVTGKRSKFQVHVCGCRKRHDLLFSFVDTSSLSPIHSDHCCEIIIFIKCAYRSLR